MNTLRKLQDWYRSQCDGDWEHGYGVKIDTLDNPGWSVTINLDGTNLEGKKFAEIGHGTGRESIEGSEDWLMCRLEEKQFKAYGGPRKLEEMLEIFLRWAEEHSFRSEVRPNGSAGDGK
jgi:hypothetical protein